MTQEYLTHLETLKLLRTIWLSFVQRECVHTLRDVSYHGICMALHRKQSNCLVHNLLTLLHPYILLILQEIDVVLEKAGI